jgi:GNAT superfamily N-acetyltransferase
VASILEVEAHAFGAWPAAEVSALGGWRLRFTHGVTRRGNSVWPGAPSGLGLAAAIDRAEGFYAARGAVPRFQLFPGGEPPALDATLEARGFALESPVSVQTAQADALAAVEPGPGLRAEVADGVGAAWWSIAGERSRFAAVPEVHRALLDRIGPRAGFALVRLGEEPVASALGVAGGALAGVFSMLTLPERRGRGAGRALLAALARWARGRGATRLYLQVERDNAAALALYARAGFRELYRYHYRLGPAR